MKLNKILALFAACVLLGAPSCSDDAPATPLTETKGENTAQSHNSLTFDWEKVTGAIQYGYELYDNNENLVTRDVTEKTTVTFGNLHPATEYTLRVWAYAAIGSGNTTSEPFELKASTDALKSLGTPNVEFSRQGVNYTFSWKKVTNADAYAYVLLNAAGETVDSGSTTSRSLKFANLEAGDYTLVLRATTTLEGFESEGESVSVPFTVEEIFVWKAQGTYRSAILGKSWDATIVYYGDDNYAIQGWYGVEGYNLGFYLDNSDPESIFNLSDNYGYDYDNSSGMYNVPTGRSDIANVWVYPWWNYSTFSGDRSAGKIKLYVWNPSAEDYATDVFSWIGEEAGAPADDFVGAWKEYLSGSTYITDSGDLEPFEYDWFDVEFTKVDDNTIAMPALYFTDETMNVKINTADKTLTADPMTVWTWYTLAGNESDDSVIVGKINDDGSLEFTNWNAWYNGWIYFYDNVAKFKR